MIKREDIDENVLVSLDKRNENWQIVEDDKNDLVTHKLEDTTQAHLPKNVGLGNVDNVKQASKTEFDEHNNDTTKHVTSVERAKWNAVDNKVDKVSGKGLSTNDYTTAEKSKLAGIEAGANKYTHPGSGTNPHGTTKSDIGLGNVDNVKQASKTDFDGHDNDSTRHITSVERTKWNEVDNKVDKVTGKGLSTNDYTTVEKNKLSGIATGANNYTHPTSHPASMITESSTKRFVSDSEKLTWNNKLDTEDLTWAKLSNKPSTFPAATHSHSWDDVTSKPSTFTPSAHTHTIANVTGLQAALNGKASTSVATTSASGLMSSSDKTKLNGIAEGA